MRRDQLACWTSLAVGGAGGVVAAWLARATGVTSTALVFVPALLAGAAMLPWRPGVQRLHVGTSVLAGMLAVGLFLWVGPVSPWRAEDIDEPQLDLLALEIVALQMSNDRGQEVRGYPNVPPHIRDLARQRVAGMSLQARRELVIDHFGPVLSASRKHRSEPDSPWVWALAAGAVGATPLGLWTLLRRSG